MLDRPHREPVRSLRCIAGRVEEVRSELFAVSCWRQLGFKLHRCYWFWRDRQDPEGGRACSDLAQAGRLRAASGDTDETG